MLHNMTWKEKTRVTYNQATWETYVNIVKWQLPQLSNFSSVVVLTM
jgi:hypothetical protein